MSAIEKPGDPNEAASDPLQEPIDAEFEPASQPPAEPANIIRKRGPGWIATMVMMLAAAGAGGALGFGAVHQLPGADGRPALVSLKAADAGQQATVEALRAEISTLQEKTAAAPAPGAVETVAQKVAQDAARAEVSRLRGEFAGLQDEVAQASRVEALARRIIALEAAGEGDGASPEAVTRSISALTARMQRLEEQLSALQRAQREASVPAGEQSARLDEMVGAVAGLQDELADLKTALDQQAARAASEDDGLRQAALAISGIEAAARRGRSFASDYDRLTRALPDAPETAALAPVAERGAWTMDRLREAFDAVARDVRLAAKPARGGGALGFAESLFGDALDVRREGELDVAAQIDAARAALADDDLGGAILALEALDGPPGEAAAGWLDEARRRHTLERALDGLRLRLLQREATQDGQ